ncbi:MAG: alpha-N-acetylglucosaminidase TIM-barrel domain-containing protein, partial [Clostridia bacterium]
MQIIHPSQAPPAYRLAAQVFQEYYAAVTGRCLPLVTQAEHSQLVVIGGTDVNAFARDAMLDGWGPDLAVASGSDGLFSTVHEGRKVLFLWGGRGRSTLYAVYHFFEKQAGCRYFWDGDIIPKSTELSIDGWNQVCKPDFALRGLRYFAHRGLHRFQAEHWSMEDWKQEIDWLLKRGLNMFMLRIGSDDLFQKAFPQWVDYPSAEEKLPEAGEGYDNRTLFWSLQYRGQLRKQVLRYAFDRDLIHPEDCGTTTHWYTRTPVQYLDQVKPAFMPQVTEVYRQPTGLVWDIRQDQNMDAYFALTKAHIREYGQPQIFHTIGLAERMCSQNREQNMRFKRMAYRRILERVEREWPGKPVLIASWDFAMHWEPPEVRQLLHELDPRRHIIFDYTADTQSTENNFLHWGFYRKFPWIFGIFHAFEPNSDLRGDYHQLSQRLELARMDEQCKGLVFWPELSHSDILMLEYFSKSAWNRVDEKNFMSDFCEDRYGKDAPAMLQLWQSLWPLMPLRVWQLDPEAAIEDIHQ